ncbi:MAG: helix-turn-helix domain-containing protein [Candidatus Korobacteraceae bacterium]
MNLPVETDGFGPKLSKLLYSRNEAAEILGVSVRTVDTLIAEKELRSTRVRGRVMVSFRELHRFATRRGE